jgi:predicted DNA-binding protein (MmcQ/YjbR family)
VAKPSAQFESLIAFALSLPGAFEDHPWGERVAKVGKKVFVFFGVPNAESCGLSVKLPITSDMALTLPNVEPTGYGLGKAGWVSARFPAKGAVPIEMLKEWVLESYRSVAPKTMVKALEGGAVPAKKSAGKTSAAKKGTKKIGAKKSGARSSAKKKASPNRTT